ncbi:MAG: glycosyltransferase involved in cell wall biosynthesis [Vicingaceae bacterium]|jgi:glycosyltransferase involved in cell wall biosynthesis
MKAKILQVVTALSWRGGEQQAAYLVQELKNEVDNFVLCSAGSKMETFCRENDITYFTQPKKGSIDFSYAKRLKQICVENRIDLIHLHDAHAHTFSILAASIFGNKTPIILSRRVDFSIKKNLFSYFKYNHRQIKKILCVSDTIKRITAAGIKDQSKLETIYSGIDLNKFKPSSGVLRKELGIEEGVFLIGNTSALADHKDYFTFIDVAERVIANHSNCHFVVMGEGPMKDEIHLYAESKSMKNQFTFTGFRNDIPEVLADLDLFLITSKTEGLGTSILDAFACSVPVVGTAGGGISELVENEITGLLCEVKNIEELTKAVERMISEPLLRENCVESAKRKVQLFSKEQTAKNTLECYLEVFSLKSFNPNKIKQ